MLQLTARWRLEIITTAVRVPCCRVAILILNPHYLMSDNPLSGSRASLPFVYVFLGETLARTNVHFPRQLQPVYLCGISCVEGATIFVYFFFGGGGV